MPGSVGPDVVEGKDGGRVVGTSVGVCVGLGVGDGVGFTVRLGVPMMVGRRVGRDGDFVDFFFRAGTGAVVGDGDTTGTTVGFGERFINIEPPVIGGRLAFPPLPDAFP